MTQIDAKAVERCYIWSDEYACGTWVRASDYNALLSERDALQAQVEGLTQERDRFEASLARACLVGGTAYLVERAQKAEADLSAALSREGAVAMEVRARDLSCAMQVFSDAGCGCDDAENIAKAIRALPIPTDAAAALARREDEVIEECARSFETQMGSFNGREAAKLVRALKRSGKE